MDGVERRAEVSHTLRGAEGEVTNIRRGITNEKVRL